MRVRRTTICCSAVALITLSLPSAFSQTLPPAPRVKQTHAANDKTPLSLFPLTTVWTLPLNAATTAPPAYDDSRAFFPLEGDRIVAYDLTEGTQLWITSVHTTSEPVAGDGLVFVLDPEALVALRAADGTLAWQLPFAETLAVPLVWDNGWLVAATSGGDLLAFRAVDGQLIWRREIGAAAHARPALAADRVYIPTTDSRIVALRVDTGEPVWEKRLSADANDILALDDRLYFGAKDKNFYCLNTEDGADEWRWRTGADTVGAPVADEKTVFFVSVDNILRALNRASGVQRWKTALPLRPSWGPIKASATLVASGAIVPSLRAYHINDGKAAGDLTTPGDGIAWPPHAAYRSSEPLPRILVVTRDIVKGATAVMLARSFEPAIAPIAPLPNSSPIPPFSPNPPAP